MPLTNPSNFKALSSSAATSTSVAASATSVSLVAANSNRIGVSIFNDSTSDLYCDFDAEASITSFAVKIAGGGYYEMPYGYTGQISGIWSDANGSAMVRELI